MKLNLNSKWYRTICSMTLKGFYTYFYVFHHQLGLLSFQKGYLRILFTIFRKDVILNKERIKLHFGKQSCFEKQHCLKVTLSKVNFKAVAGGGVKEDICKNSRKLQGRIRTAFQEYSKGMEWEMRSYSGCFVVHLVLVPSVADMRGIPHIMRVLHRSG